MNSTAWKLMLTANCLIASSAAWAANSGTPPNQLGHISNAIHHQHMAPALDKSKFQYMDSTPVYNSQHVRAAVMVFEKKPDHRDQCATMTGAAKHHCYELSMPT